MRFRGGVDQGLGEASGVGVSSGVGLACGVPDGVLDGVLVAVSDGVADGVAAGVEEDGGEDERVGDDRCPDGVGAVVAEPPPPVGGTARTPGGVDVTVPDGEV